MAISLTIGGASYTAYVDPDSIQVSDTYGIRGDTLAFELDLAPASVTKPVAGQEVILLDGSTKEFAGILTEAREVPTGLPTRYHYQCDCVDYTRWLDRVLVNNSYAAGDVGTMVRTIISEVDTGSIFSVTNVASPIGFNVPAQDFRRVVPSNVIDQLASQIGCQWYIDFDKAVHFFVQEANVGPVAQILIDSNTSDYYDLEIWEDISQIKNRIYVGDHKIKSTDTWNQDGFVGDAVKTFLPLSYEPWSLDDVTVTLDGVSQTILRDGVDGSAGDGQTFTGAALICLENWGVRFAPAPGSGVVVATDYNYASSQGLELMVEDIAAQAEMASREGGNGVYEHFESLPSVRAVTDAAAKAIAEIILAKSAWPIGRATFKSRTKGWRTGQYFQLTSTTRNWDKRMYITSVTKTVLRAATPNSEDTIIESEIECCDNAYGGYG